MIAAIYVQTGGSYFNLPGVDPWDEARDARFHSFFGPRWCTQVRIGRQRDWYSRAALTTNRIGVR